jgi:hypothetical protein
VLRAATAHGLVSVALGGATVSSADERVRELIARRLCEAGDVVSTRGSADPT